MKASQHPCAMVNIIIERNAPCPGEEDFWVILIITQSSEELLFAQSGKLVDVAEEATWFMKTNKTGPCRALSFQGEKARWAMEAILMS
jgi:hypothetical protein